MDAFIGEIRVFPWNWTPQGWLPCNGQTLSVYQYQALSTVIGNAWGPYSPPPNGTFTLPNLNGVAVIGAGQGPGLTPRVVGKTVGEAAVTLVPATMPSHSHSLNFAGSSRNAPGSLTAIPTATAVPAQEVTVMTTYNTGPADSTLGAPTVGATGSQAALLPHSNIQPCLVMQFYINWDGTYPVPAN